MAAPQVPGTPPPGQIGRDNLARQSGVTGVNQIGQDVYQVQFANGLKTNLRGDAGRKAFEQYSGGAPPPPKDAEGNRVGKAVDAPPGAPPQAAAPAGQAPPKDSVLPYAAEGIDPATQRKFVGQAVMKDGQMMVVRPGTPGTPGGVTALGKDILQGRAAAEQAAAPLERDAAEAAKLESIRQQQDVANRQAAVADQQIRAVIDQQNQEQEALEADKHAADLQARADAAMNEYTSSRPPERSTEESIVSGIAAGLGALGAALARTPNFAESFLNQLAANKMRKWEAEVALKGKRADNLLARYTAALGDAKLAKVAVKETILRQAALEEEQAALATGTEKYRNTHQQMASAAAAAAIRAAQEKDAAFKVDFYGNKMLNRPGTAGSAATFLPATQGAYGERVDQNKAAEELRLKQAAADREKAEGAAGAKVPDAVKKSVAELDAAIAGIKRLEETDKKLGKPINILPGGGALAWDETNELAAAAAAIAPGVARATEGDAATKDSMDRAVSGLAAGAPGQRQHARDQYIMQLEAKKKAILDSQ